MKKYKAILFSPDGDWVTDYRADTIDEVQESLANGGSRWFFYPFEAIIVDRGGYTTHNQRIIVAYEPFEFWVGKAISTISKYLEKSYNEGSVTE